MNSPSFANASETLVSVRDGFLPKALEQEIRKIYDRSPLYARRFPLHAEPLQWSCYREIPALSKKEIIHEGRIGTLKRFKDDANEVRAGLECGIKLDDFNGYQAGDVIEVYEIQKVRASL